MKTKTQHTPGSWYYEFGTDTSSKAEAEANARLIAAAPDLIEVAQTIASMSIQDRDNGAWAILVEGARAAIAKAKP